MPITAVKEKPEGLESSQDLSWARSYARLYQVIATKDVGPAAIRTGIPVAIGDTWSFGAESDLGAYCNGIRARCTGRIAEHSLAWDVEVSYGPVDPAIRPQNPLDEQPEIAWGWAQFQAAVFEDRNGDPILNTARDYFDPPISKDDSRPVLTLVRNEASFSQDLADSLRDSVNNATWFGAAAGKVKISNISAVRVYSGELAAYYWKVTYEFQFNRYGWSSRPLNQGFRQLSADGTKQVPIFKDGCPVSSPALLDASGHALAVSGTPVFLEFDVYPESDFSALGFDAFYALLTS